jgi:CRP-like cAMP-binding protein
MTGKVVAAEVTVELLAQLERMLGLALPRLEAVLASVRVLEVKRREFALIEGEPAPYVFAVRTGLLKQCYSTPGGDEAIKSFTSRGQIFACPNALRPNGRATFSSVAIEDSIVERIDFAIVEALAEEHVEWQKALRVAFQWLAEIKVQRERDLLLLDAEGLYEKYSEESPELVARVPQKDLAAYLGVTPVGLNRIVSRARQRQVK